MKKYPKYLAILAAAALTACSSDGGDTPTPPESQDGISDTPIALSINIGSEFLNGDEAADGRSRASFNSGNLGEITVMACNGTNRYFTCRATGSGASWNTHDGFTDAKKTYYWPWSGMDVYAFAGNMSNTSNNLVNNNSNLQFIANGGYIYPNTFNYKVVNDNPVNDPLFAAHVGCRIQEGIVDLNFRHLLSRITFAVVNDNEDDQVDVQIDHIAFPTVYASGPYTTAGRQTADSGKGVTHPSYGAWSNLGNRANCSTYETLGQHFTKMATSATAKAVCKPGTSVPYELLLMPQALDNNVRLAVNYSIKSVKTGRVIRPMSWQSIQVTNVDWKQNTQYIYQLHILEQIIQVEIFPVAFDVNPFITGGTITPPVKD